MTSKMMNEFETTLRAKGHGVESDGCAPAAGSWDQRLRHDGRSLPAPFLPELFGSAMFPLENGALSANGLRFARPAEAA